MRHLMMSETCKQLLYVKTIEALKQGRIHYTHLFCQLHVKYFKQNIPKVHYTVLKKLIKQLKSK